jgi:hypothetical protein
MRGSQGIEADVAAFERDGSGIHGILVSRPVEIRSMIGEGWIGAEGGFCQLRLEELNILDNLKSAQAST